MRAVLVLVASSLAMAAASDDLDARIERELKREHVPALTLAVVRRGAIIRQGAYGVGNLEWNAAATIHTRFEVASISKMFVGAAVRILIEDGKLDPETAIGTYFDGLPEAWTAIRVRHLITMSSGLPEDFASDLIPYNRDVTTPYDDASMVRHSRP